MLYKYIFPSWGAATAEAGFVRRHRDLSRMEPLSMLVIPRKSSIEDEFELSQDISFHHLRVENTLGTIRNNEEVDLMLEKVCPPEEEGIANKIFPTHCNGLVCIATNMDQVFVCNPATHELVALPRGTPDVRDVKEPSAVLGFDASRNQYVVARYFYQYFHNNTSSRVLSYEIGHEVFTLGGSSWECTDEPPDAIGNTRPVFTRGAFYWGTYAPHDPQESVLVRFSLCKRRFDVVPSPPGFTHLCEVDYLADLNNKLCYVKNITDANFIVWQLEDDGTRLPQWSPLCSINPLNRDLGAEAFFPVWAGWGGIIVFVDYEKLYWYEEKIGYMKELVDLEEEVDFERQRLHYGGNFYRSHVIPYMESLISIRMCNY
uniref:F-box associated beta-propeller type 3 domain-containing protein n=1 Tax=Hordeum vulgare subsp. vulgare TaxID=112509 RepID=A0A8I6WHX5_HORVV